MKRTASALLLILSLCLTPTLLLTSTASGQCQPPFPRTWIAFADNGSSRDTLWFGYGPIASYGINIALCETELPPAPPAGVFDVRFVNIPGREGTDTPNGLGQGTRQDYRSHTNERDTFKIKFQPSDAGFPVSCNWNLAGIQAIYDSAWLQDEFGGVIFRVRMQLSNQHTFVSPAFSSALIIVFRTLTDVNEQTKSLIPDSWVLEQNYPNPFNPVTTFQFSIINRQLTILKVYDLLGREVATIVNENLEPGIYQRTFSGEGLSSGVYFYRLTSGGFTETRKLLLMK